MGGELKLESVNGYIGGEIFTIEGFDADLLSIPHFNKYVKSKGYNNIVTYWYKFESEDMTKVKNFESDVDIRNILNYCAKNGNAWLEIYVVHQGETLDIMQEQEDGNEEQREAYLNLVGCDFPDSDIEQVDIFCEDGLGFIEAEVSNFMKRKESNLVAEYVPIEPNPTDVPLEQVL